MIHESINKRVGEHDECKIISPYAFYMMLFCIVKDALLNGKRAPFEMRFVTYWKRVSYKAENNRLWMKLQLLVASFL